MKTSVAWVVAPYHPPTRQSTHHTSYHSVQAIRNKKSCQPGFLPATGGKVVNLWKIRNSLPEGRSAPATRVPSPCVSGLPRSRRSSPPATREGWRQAMADYEHWHPILWGRALRSCIVRPGCILRTRTAAPAATPTTPGRSETARARPAPALRHFTLSETRALGLSRAGTWRKQLRFRSQSRRIQ